MLLGRVRLLDLDRAHRFSIRPEREPVISLIYCVEPVTPAQSKELRELVLAVEMFVENYRLMHAGTVYGPDVEAAAADVRAKLNEL